MGWGSDEVCVGLDEILEAGDLRSTSRGLIIVIHLGVSMETPLTLSARVVVYLSNMHDEISILVSSIMTRLAAELMDSRG